MSILEIPGNPLNFDFSEYLNIHSQQGMEDPSSLIQTGRTNLKQGNVTCTLLMHQNSPLNFNTNFEVCTSYKVKSFLKKKIHPTNQRQEQDIFSWQVKRNRWERNVLQYVKWSLPNISFSLGFLNKFFLFPD